MATRTLLRTRQFENLYLARGEDGVIPPQEIDRLAESVSGVLGVLAGGLSVGTGGTSTVAGNFRGTFIDHIFSSAANTYENIPHGLGVVPVLVLPVLKDRACDIYDANFGVRWGTDRVYLSCSIASAKVKLLLLA